jgi:hypothetical protein
MSPTQIRHAPSLEAASSPLASNLQALTNTSNVQHIFINPSSSEIGRKKMSASFSSDVDTLDRLDTEGFFTPDTSPVESRSESPATPPSPIVNRQSESQDVFGSIESQSSLNASILARKLAEIETTSVLQESEQKFDVKLSDVQVVVCRVKQGWRQILQNNETTKHHLVEKFSVECSVIKSNHARDEEAINLVVNAKLPALRVNVSEDKIIGVYACLQAALMKSSSKSTTPSTPTVSFPSSTASIPVTPMPTSTQNRVIFDLTKEQDSTPSLRTDQLSEALRVDGMSKLPVNKKLLEVTVSLEELYLSLTPRSDRDSVFLSVSIDGTHGQLQVRPYDRSATFQITRVAVVDHLQPAHTAFRNLIATSPGNDDSSAFITVSVTQFLHCPIKSVSWPDMVVPPNRIVLRLDIVINILFSLLLRLKIVTEDWHPNRPPFPSGSGYPRRMRLSLLCSLHLLLLGTYRCNESILT